MPRPAVSTEDVAMEAAATYFWFADRFDWTPDTVDNLPVWLKERLPAVASIHDELAEERAKKDSKST